jgi:hypothetical protein
MDLLPALSPPKLVTVCAPGAAREPIAHLAAALALRDQVTVLDGGNRFQPYRVAQLLRQRTTRVDQAARNIFIRRAFTCYQMLALLENTPALRQPYLILDLLATFYDEHVSEREARRLLGACLRELERLSRNALVVVSLSPPLLAERAFLVESVCARAGRVFSLAVPTPVETQLSLFPVKCQGC